MRHASVTYSKITSIVILAAENYMVLIWTGVGRYVQSTTVIYGLDNRNDTGRYVQSATVIYIFVIRNDMARCHLQTNYGCYKHICCSSDRLICESVTLAIYFMINLWWKHTRYIKCGRSGNTMRERTMERVPLHWFVFFKLIWKKELIKYEIPKICIEINTTSKTESSFEKQI